MQRTMTHPFNIRFRAFGSPPLYRRGLTDPNKRPELNITRITMNEGFKGMLMNRLPEYYPNNSMTRMRFFKVLNDPNKK